MCLACNALGNLWDEFTATAAYLTTLTAASAKNRRTPYKLWFKCRPSLSHLCKISCQAFALTLPAPSKIHVCSSPCVLIRYAPHSKVYCLWDPAASCVFNSFHVTFIEHLDAEPHPLHPSKVLGTSSTNCPPSWDVAGPPSPSLEEPNPRPFSNIPETPPSPHP